MNETDMNKIHLDGSHAEVETAYFKVVFQHGAPHEVGINGCRVEDVIDLVIEKLLDFQSRALACDENATALHHLTLAKKALVERRQKREQQGVYGQAAPHESA